MSNYYAGVGARKTPNDILKLMERIAKALYDRNYILRSGGAVGADTAFEKGAKDKKEIFYANDSTFESVTMAGQYHPNWNACSFYEKKLHGRNVFQVLGKNLNDPVKVLICWTPDGCQSHKDRKRETGGTGTAISIADVYAIPIYNLKNDLSRDKLMNILF